MPVFVSSSEDSTRTTPLTERELREEFDRYRKLVEDLSRRFSVDPVPPTSTGEGRPDTIQEARFIYEVHAT